MKSLGKHITFLVLLGLGLLLVPSKSYACSKKPTAAESGQSPYSKETFEKTKHKDSCKDKECKTCRHNKGCDTNCNHSSCRCSTSTSYMSVPIVFELNTKNQFAELEKHKTGYKHVDYSSVYFSIWQPPKIS